MKKATYLTKYAAATVKVTDATTVRELKERKAAEAALRRFWKKAATRWLETNILHEPLDVWVAAWRGAEFVFDVKPTGTVVVRLYGYDDMVPRSLIQEVRIPKKELYTK